MDQDDPAKRTADLEQRLGPSAPNAGSGTEGDRHFVAYAVADAWQPILALGLLLVLAWVVVAVVATVAGPILDSVHFPIVPLGFVAVLGVGSVLILRRSYSKEVGLVVTAAGLIVDGRASDVFPLWDAQLGQWTGPWRRGLPDAKGRALFLTCGANRYVVGSADQGAGDSRRPDGPQVGYSGLDARMSTQLFDELLDIVAQQQRSGRRPGPAPSPPPRPQPDFGPENEGW